MVGYSKDFIARNSYDLCHSSSRVEAQNHSDQLISEAIREDELLQIAIMNYPQSPLSPFMNLQSYVPLRDPCRQCHYIMVFHCDIWKHRKNTQYLQKLDIRIDMLSKAVIPHRDHGQAFLHKYFYSNENEGGS